MSADNGIYILGTHNHEYRVIHAQNIEDIFNIQAVWEYFHEAPVFFSLTPAIHYAQDLAEDVVCPILKYGTSRITCPFPFPKERPT